MGTLRNRRGMSSKQLETIMAGIADSQAAVVGEVQALREEMRDEFQVMRQQHDELSVKVDRLKR